MALFQHIRHPRITAWLAERPVKVADLLPRGNTVKRFNTRVALPVTRAVGSMWCAYAFAPIAPLSAPSPSNPGADGPLPDRPGILK